MRTIGNVEGLEYHPEYLEYLGVTPTKLRVYYVPEHCPVDDVSFPWQVDGVAVVDGQLAYSESVHNFETWAEAIDDLPSMWTNLVQ